MTLYDRYIDGDHKGVWATISENASLRNPVESERVANEMLRRVRHNVELIIMRLEALGFQFVLPSVDGPSVPGPIGPIAFTKTTARFCPADDEDREQVRAIQKTIVSMPLALISWYETVGTVCLIGDLENLCEYKTPHRLKEDNVEILPDPLVVMPLSLIKDELESDRLTSERKSVRAVISPNAMTKAAYSSSSQYEIEFQTGVVDPLLLNESHGLTFVNYLRLSLAWGGFPGWSSFPDKAPAEIRFLTKNLIPF
jgi:hypothetical protein